MVSFKRRKLVAALWGSVVLISSVSAKNPALSRDQNLAELRCILEAKPSKNKKSNPLKSRRPAKIWKMGDSGFGHDQFCNKRDLNPLALADARFHYKSKLSEDAQWILNGARKPAAESFLAPTENSKVLSSEKGAAQHFVSLADRMHFASSCEKKFIGSSGFGPLGKVVKETLSKSSAKKLLHKPVTFGGACPNYPQMTNEQRKNLWVFVMMSMSHYESSCQEQVLNIGPNGVAAGILQLHHDHEDLYVSSDPDLTCDKGVASDAPKSLRCGLTMIENQIAKSSSFFDDRSHWQVLRFAEKPGTQAYQIRYALSQIPDCQGQHLYYQAEQKAAKPSKVKAEAEAEAEAVNEMPKSLLDLVSLR